MGGNGAALRGLVSTLPPLLVWWLLELFAKELQFFVLLVGVSLNLLLLLLKPFSAILLRFFCAEWVVFGECDDEFKHNPLSSELV